MKKLRDNQQRAQNAVIMIWIVLGFEVLSLFSSYLQYSLLQSISNGSAISDEALVANDLREGVAAIFYAIAALVSGITFIQWFRRAYYNLHQLIPNLNYTEGWAAGAWFVPILNLFRPYQIMKELYGRTQTLLIEKDPEMRKKLSTENLDWWWFIWIVSGVIGVFLWRLANEDTIDGQIISTMGNMILSILNIPLALITIKVIKNYSNVEPELHNIEEDRENDLILEYRI